MKIVRPNETDNKWYLHFNNNCFIHSINDWEQIFGHYNWYTFHFLHIYAENDIMVPGIEFEIVILGIGFRFRYNKKSFNDSIVGKRLKELEEK